MFTPHKPSKNKLIYTDHLSLYVKFEGIPEVSKSFQKDEKLVSWNTNKEDGWKAYLDATTNNEMLEDLAMNADMRESNQIMSRMSKMINKIKLNCFGKVKVSHGSDSNRRLDELYNLKSYAVNMNNESEANHIETKYVK